MKKVNLTLGMRF